VIFFGGCRKCPDVMCVTTIVHRIVGMIQTIPHSLPSAHTFTSVIGSPNVRDYFRFNTRLDDFFLNNLRQCFPVSVLRTVDSWKQHGQQWTHGNNTANSGSWKQHSQKRIYGNMTANSDLLEPTRPTVDS
jgi:hypothetical protein